MQKLSDLSLRAAIPIAIALALGGAPTGALAQTAPKVAADSDAILTEVVVTGSRIARPEADRLQPTTVLDSDLIEKHAYTNVIDALAQLPAFGTPGNSLVGGQSGFGIGQSFANFLSLGSQRTLTLVDGRRFVPANSPSIFGATGAGGEQVDLNVIPTLLIDRVETISIGGAPIYGSDAVAGTVNIIMKHNFEGFEADASAGISGRGDAPEERLRLLAGKNFADGRGNIEVSAEIANMAGLVGQQRPRINYDNAYIQNPGTTPYAYVLTANQRLASITTQGVPMTDDAFLNFNPETGIFDPTGQLLSFGQGGLVPYNPGPPDPQGVFNIGGDGLDFAKLTSLLSPQERINGTILGNFEINSHAKLYGEVWYSETHTEFLEGQGQYDTGLFAPAGVVSGNLIISANNPFLSAADRATIQQNLAAYAAIPGNPTQVSQFYLARLNQDVGNGGASANQNTKRAVVGVKGDLGFSDWAYDVSANYGQTANASLTPSLNFQNFTNALNAVPGPNGTIICAPGYVNSPVPTQSSTCAPFNPFGNALYSAAANAYVNDLAAATSTLTQRVFTVALNGTVFNLPGGAVKLAAGYENRRESADFEPDQFYQQGVGYDIPILPSEGAFLTNEIFGELLLPVISPSMNIPFVHKVEIEAAARDVRSSISGSATTWTAGARYEPVGMLQFRGNYTRSIRAPSVTEAFAPPAPAFSTAVDPCDHTNVNSGPDPATRAKNCAAGLPGVNLATFNSDIQSFTEQITVSGNPTLGNEVADSKTFGFVLRPLPKMSLSVDWVSISIEQVITTDTATSVLEKCYDDPTFPNSACGAITRTPDGQVVLVKTGYANEGYQQLNGVQTEFDYSYDLPMVGSMGSLGTLDFRLNDYFENHNKQAVGTSDVISAPGTIGDSKHRGTIDLTWTRNGVFADWQSRYIGRAKFDNGVAPNFTEVQGVNSWWVNNLTIGATPMPNLRIQLVVDNVFDKQPPNPLPAVPPTANGGSGTSTYFSGLMGRYFTASFNYKIP